MLYKLLMRHPNTHPFQIRDGLANFTMPNALPEYITSNDGCRIVISSEARACVDELVEINPRKRKAATQMLENPWLREKPTINIGL